MINSFSTEEEKKLKTETTTTIKLIDCTQWLYRYIWLERNKITHVEYTSVKNKHTGWLRFHCLFI
jgi:hypothetical protein